MSSTEVIRDTMQWSTTLPPAHGDYCDIYKDWRRRSKGFIIRGYEGIPQNLLLNIVGLIILVIAFSFLRKKAWNYGRIALLNDVGWSSIFYTSPIDKIKGRTGRHQQIPIHAEVDDRGYFDWIKITYSLTDRQFLEKSGPDALQYLSYQRHLIFLGAIITLTSLIIVLPLNLQGATESDIVPDISVFEQSTIFNLGSDSRLLWVHEMLALFFLAMSVIVMRHFSRSLRFVQFDPAQRRTLVVAGIAKRYCTEGRIRAHFLALHQDCEITEFNLAYDVSKLVELNDEKEGVVTARKYWEEYVLHNRTSYRPLMRPYTCGNLCCCCCCLVQTTDALNYYTNMEYKLRRQSELERLRAFAKPLGIAFVTFSTVEMAEKILREYRLTARLLMQIPVTNYSRRLKSRNWVVAFAPLPDDLYWQNLCLGYRAWYFRACVVNLTLVLIVLFYSTPVFLLNAMNVYLKIQQVTIDQESGDNVTTTAAPRNSNSTENFSLSPSTIEGVLRDTVPTFLLWLAAVTLPSLVSLSDRFVGFWTKTAENRSKMIKTFTFLLFMVIILPSLGLTSASSFFLRDEPPKWKCIFQPSNGSFFVNYVITSCFLGTMSELMRIPELLVYGIKICFAKSAADIGAIRRSVLWDFQLGSQYAWMMLIFAIFILFSLVTPIITIFGFIYLIFKHYVDRYNIYFAYAPCKVDKSVHGTAINFVIICAFLVQLILVAYTHSNAQPVVLHSAHRGRNQILNKPLQSFAILAFCITATLFIGQVFFNMCTGFSAIAYANTKTVEVPITESRKRRERRLRQERRERRAKERERALARSQHREELKPVAIPNSRSESPAPISAIMPGPGSPKATKSRTASPVQFVIPESSPGPPTLTKSRHNSSSSAESRAASPVQFLMPEASPEAPTLTKSLPGSPTLKSRPGSPALKSRPGSPTLKSRPDSPTSNITQKTRFLTPEPKPTPMPIMSPPKPSGDAFNGQAPLQIMAQGVRESLSAGALYTRRKSNASETTESVEERTDPEEHENLYRPGIDKPYGHYFPTILRLDFDRESTIQFNAMYFKGEEMPDLVHSPVSTNFVRDELVLESHNKRPFDPLNPDLSAAASVAVVVSQGDFSDDSSSSFSSNEDEPPPATMHESLPPGPDVNFNHQVDVHDGERFFTAHTSKAASPMPRWGAHQPQPQPKV